MGNKCFFCKALNDLRRYYRDVKGEPFVIIEHPVNYTPILVLRNHKNNFKFNRVNALQALKEVGEKVYGRFGYCIVTSENEPKENVKHWHAYCKQINEGR